MINYICEGIPGQTGISGNPGAPGIPGVDGCNGTDGNFSFDIFLFHAELENSWDWKCCWRVRIVTKHIRYEHTIDIKFSIILYWKKDHVVYLAWLVLMVLVVFPDLKVVKEKRVRIINFCLLLFHAIPYKWPNFLLQSNVRAESKLWKYFYFFLIYYA